MDRLSLTAKLGTLISVALAGLLLLGLVSYRTLGEVKVNGRSPPPSRTRPP